MHFLRFIQLFLLLAAKQSFTVKIMFESPIYFTEIRKRCMVKLVHNLAFKSFLEQKNNKE